MAPGRETPLARAGRARWWATFGLLLAMTALWSLATPLMAAPDEPAHTVKAAAVVRGQLFGTTEPATSSGPSPFVKVRVPSVFTRTNLLPGCYAFKIAVPASCAPALRSGGPVVTFATPAGRYEPLYYAVVGLPSLAFRSPGGIRAMRLVGAALCAAFLASAIESARRRSALAVAGVAAASTPTVLFLASTVNPNGLEVAAAVCLWASGLVLVLDEPGAPVGRLVTRVGLSACVLVQARALSLLWTALIGVVLLVMADPGRRRELLQRRDVVLWAVALGVCTAFAAAWLLAFDPLAVAATPPARPLSGSAILETSLGRIDMLVSQMIGVVGWADTYPPALAFYGWLAVVAALAALGIAGGNRRAVAMLGFVVVATIGIPLAIEASQAPRVGFIWEGRYTLPLAVGIPIVSAVSVPAELAARLGARLPGLLVATTTVAQLSMFLVALRRYTVGLTGPLDFFAGPWRPPLGAPVLTGLFVLVAACFAFVLRRLGQPVAADAPG